MPDLMRSARARQCTFPQRVASGIVSKRRCTMRLRGLAVVTGGILFPFILLAQHTVAPAPVPAPVHVSPPVVHVPAAPSAGIHTSTIPPARTPGATPATGTQSSHTHAGTARDPQATRVRDKVASQSVANSSYERRGIFSLLRRHGPLQEGLQSNCKHGRCSSNGTSFAPVAVAEVGPAKARLGCTVVSVNDPAVPCNPLAPCCP